MKFFAFSSFFSLALMTGCAASTDNADSQNSDVNASQPRNAIELPSSQDESSLQGQLFKLLETFKSDPYFKVAVGIESAAYQMSGANEPGETPSVTCSKSDMEIVAPGGGGYEHKTNYVCTLEGWGQNRGGGTLPNVVIPTGKEAPLAGKLFTLLKRGYGKGGFGVKQTEKNDDPPCCDIPMTETLVLSDKDGELSCTNATGGFAFIVQTSCEYTRVIAPNE